MINDPNCFFNKDLEFHNNFFIFPGDIFTSRWYKPYLI